MELADNGHYYELVRVADQITWDGAKVAAESRSYLGYQGTLATVRFEAENDFVYGLGPALAWLGGYQRAGSVEPDGGWRWITGEEWSFTKWDSGEPNNLYAGDRGGPPAGSPEEALHIRWNGMWNDLPHDSYLPAYVVEYGPAEEVIPEPSCLVMFAGLLASLCVGYVWRKRRGGAGLAAAL
jgi:hypothetical protein